MKRSTALGRGRRALARAGLLVAGGALVAAPLPAQGHVSSPFDPLHGGSGTGKVVVVGHSDLDAAGDADPGGLNGHVAVLGDHAYVGYGANGGTAFNWGKTPTCNADAAVNQRATVKVVSLADPGNPTVVARISVDQADPTSGAPPNTVARDVAAMTVSTPFFTGDLLAVALESCSRTGDGAVGVNFYDVSDPANPVLLGRDDRFFGNTATRQVTLVQRADGRLFALLADQGGFLGGIHVTDATNPALPVPIATFDTPQVDGDPSTRECRPFSFAQGVSANTAGTRAYAAYQDQGLFVLDIDNIPLASGTSPLPQLAQISHTEYADPDDEGNSFRYVPNAAETVAVATDEDIMPARTSLTITSSGSSSSFTEPGGSTPGVFRGCEAVWGSGAPASGPLYRRTATSLVDRTVVDVNFGCAPADYAGQSVAGNIVLTARGGTCSFDARARLAQDPDGNPSTNDGAAAVLISNAATDHHLDGSGVLFSPDSVQTVDAGVTIPVAMITKEAGDSIRADLATGAVTATLADNADSDNAWGALRVFDLTAAGGPAQLTRHNSPHSDVLTAGDALYHAVNTVWDGDKAVVSWMSDGLRVVDLATPASPAETASYVPPGVADPTGNYAAVPLVVDAEPFGTNRYVISDINGGLYVVQVNVSKDDCKNGGWESLGFPDQATCIDYVNNAS